MKYLDLLPLLGWCMFQCLEWIYYWNWS